MTTYSLGSICLGSLLVALINALRAMVHQARQTDDSIVICIADCILGIIEGIAEFFNRWAFIYVGLYGYTFMEAGRNVMRLFKSRGWTMIINEDLINNVLMFMSLSVGAVVGGVGMVYYEIDEGGFEGLNDLGIEPKWIIFLSGLILGTLLSSVMLNCVQSAADTVVVCFAEAPLDFANNYPQMAEDMNNAWMKVYPMLWRGGQQEQRERDGQDNA